MGSLDIVYKHVKQIDDTILNRSVPIFGLIRSSAPIISIEDMTCYAGHARTVV